MISFREPSVGVIHQFLTDQSNRPYTYAYPGATTAQPPAGFIVDRHSIHLGSGHETFKAAKTALQQWNQLRLGWINPAPSTPPLEVGRVVGLLVHTFGLWWLNASRIVYILDDDTATVCRYGFAYGTLPGHAECGEERFHIEWDRSTNEVSYSIFAFSRPRHILAKLGYPLVRRLQKRFARESMSQMWHMVENYSAQHVAESKVATETVVSTGRIESRSP